ncbi:MAG TPA: general stress protein [Xenococcaceae cyanobacterium]
MATNELRHAIGTFANREDAEYALRELQDAGFNMDKVSVIAKNAEPEERMGGVEVKSTGEQAKGGAAAGATAGAATGGLLGLIGGLGVIALPGVGVAAELGVVLANTLLGGGIGAAGGGLVGALIGWGIPEDRAKYYDEMISQGRYVILMEGTEAEINGAEAILKNRRIQDWGVYGTMPNTYPNTGMGIV